MVIELYVGDRVVKDESQVLSLHPLLHEKTNYHSNRQLRDKVITILK